MAIIPDEPTDRIVKVISPQMDLRIQDQQSIVEAKNEQEKYQPILRNPYDCDYVFLLQ